MLLSESLRVRDPGLAPRFETAGPQLFGVRQLFPAVSAIGQDKSQQRARLRATRVQRRCWIENKLRHDLRSADVDSRDLHVSSARKDHQGGIRQRIGNFLAAERGGRDIKIPAQQQCGNVGGHSLIGGVWQRRTDRYSELRTSFTRLPAKGAEMYRLGG